MKVYRERGWHSIAEKMEVNVEAALQLVHTEQEA
jgi:hypothetical protein